MKNISCWIPMVVLLMLCGCAKEEKVGQNDSAKRYFDAWILVNHPDARKTELGAYIIADEEGPGPMIGSADISPYVRGYFTTSDLDGHIDRTNVESLARQIGKDDGYFGPVFVDRVDDVLYAGLDEMLSTMRVGGKRTVAIPGWLCSYDRYQTAGEYEKHSSGTHMLYTADIREIVNDVVKWEVDSVMRYMNKTFPGKSLLDSLKNGFYYVRTGEPSSKDSLVADTTVYINYVGRFLDGKVFDTNVKDTARHYGIYSESGTYGPVDVKVAGDYSDVQMGSSTVIEGFGRMIKNMHADEKGVGVFYSRYGYGSGGYEDKIPAFCPLRFDIELVKEP